MRSTRPSRRRGTPATTAPETTRTVTDRTVTDRDATDHDHDATDRRIVRDNPDAVTYDRDTRDVDGDGRRDDRPTSV